MTTSTDDIQSHRQRQQQQRTKSPNQHQHRQQQRQWNTATASVIRTAFVGICVFILQEIRHFHQHHHGGHEEYYPCTKLDAVDQPQAQLQHRQDKDDTATVAATEGGGGGGGKVSVNSVINETDYTWLGLHHYIPPVGIPLYTVEQLQTYYKDKSILWLGDSTGRRAYFTLYELLAAVRSTSSSLDGTESRDDDSHQYYSSKYINDTKDILEEQIERQSILDIGRSGNNVEFNCINGIERRDFNNKTHARGVIWGNPTTIVDKKNQQFHYNISTEFYCRKMPNGTGKGMAPRSTSASPRSTERQHNYFDFGFASCINTITKYFQHDMDNMSTIRDYDIVVISVGIWEWLRESDCTDSGQVEKMASRIQRVQKFLQTLIQYTSNGAQSSPYMVVRTIGYTHGKEGFQQERINEINTLIKNLIDEHSNKNKQNNVNKLMYLDWAKVIEKRSFGEKRLKGDIPPHYGFTARTLLIQMLTYKLITYVE